MKKLQFCLSETGITDIARKSFTGLPHLFPSKFHVVLCVDVRYFLKLCHHDATMY